MIMSLKSEHGWSLHLHRDDANVGPHLREVQDTKPVAAHEPGQAAGRLFVFLDRRCLYTLDTICLMLYIYIYVYVYVYIYIYIV